MNKVFFKLIAMTLALVLSVSLVVMSSYAWLVLSGNPVTTGIQVAVAGGNTILTAPNVRTVAEDGTIYNYPGHFSDRLNFGQQSDYAYLHELGNLTPVSTANGIDWVLPVYYSGDDPEVQQGKIPSGALKDFSEFQVDSELAHANLPADAKDEIKKGSYIYLDFWVMSPGGDYTLRISTGDEGANGGSFVIDLLETVISGDSYTMAAPKGSAASAVRVGFLANDVTLVDGTMLNYKNSKFFDQRVTSLRGLYQEPNSGTAYLDADRFLIYEPNGDSHPESQDVDGCYVATKPLGLENGKIREQNIRNLTVQRTSIWSLAENGIDTAVEQRFQTAIRARIWNELNTSQIEDRFYNQYLQGQISPYVSKGQFFRSTNNLLAWLNAGNGLVHSDTLNQENAGATEDVYIVKLERNVPQRIRMFIWLEGQDIDCVDSISASRFAVNIELAGGNT